MRQRWKLPDLIWTQPRTREVTSAMIYWSTQAAILAQNPGERKQSISWLERGHARGGMGRTGGLSLQACHRPLATCPQIAGRRNISVSLPVRERLCRDIQISSWDPWRHICTIFRHGFDFFLRHFLNWSKNLASEGGVYGPTRGVKWFREPSLRMPGACSRAGLVGS